MHLSRLVVCISVATVLAACTTTPKPSMTPQQLTANSPLDEQLLDTLAKRLSVSAALGDQESEFMVAGLYFISRSQEQRKKAVPWLIQLEKENNPTATRALVRMELEGAAGYLSLDRYKKHKDLLAKETPEMLVSIAELTKFDDALRVTHKAEMQRLVDTHAPLCEQPLKDFKSKLPDDLRATLTVSYLRSCLIKYSDKNSTARYAAVAEITDLFCKMRNPNKPCSAQGYRVLTKPTLTSDDFKAASLAVGEILSHNDDYLKYQTHSLGEEYKSSSKQVFKRIAELKEAKNYTAAIKEAEQLKATKLPPLDAAMTDFMLATLMALREDKADVPQIVALYQALQSNEWLSSKARWAGFMAMQEVLIKAGRYQEMLQSSTQLIVKNQGPIEMLPPTFMAEFKRLTTPAPVVPAPTATSSPAAVAVH